MLESFHSHPRPQKNNRYTSFANNNLETMRKYVTIDFKEDRKTFGKFRKNKQQKEDNFFRTFYSKERQNLYRYQKNKERITGRETAFTQRQTIIGTPFTSIEAKDNELIVPILPSFDRQRYKYLLTAISDLSKTKKLPQFRNAPPLKGIYHHNMQQSISPDRSPSPNNIGDIGTPRIVNLSADFKHSQKNYSKSEFDNAFQKMFKNKKLLQKGRYPSFRQSSDKKFQIFLLGQDELTVHQVPLQNRKKKSRAPF